MAMDSEKFSIDYGDTKLSTAHFEKFEKEFGYSIKGELREFYTLTNGGILSNQNSKFPFFIQNFYPLYSDGARTAVRQYEYLLEEGELESSDLFPFADIPGGLCLISLTSGRVTCRCYETSSFRSWKTLNNFFNELCGQTIAELQINPCKANYEIFVDTLDFESIKMSINNGSCTAYEVWFYSLTRSNFKVVKFLVENKFDTTGVLHVFLGLAPTFPELDSLLECGIDINELGPRGEHILDVKPSWKELLIDRGAKKDR